MKTPEEIADELVKLVTYETRRFFNRDLQGNIIEKTEHVSTITFGKGISKYQLMYDNRETGESIASYLKKMVIDAISESKDQPNVIIPDPFYVDILS